MTPLGFLCLKKGSPMKTVLFLVLTVVAIKFGVTALNNSSVSSLEDRKSEIERAVANM
jgi:hypothetical protein